MTSATNLRGFRSVYASAALWLLAAALAPAISLSQPATAVPAASLLQPAELALMLKDAAAAQPLLLHVGFRQLFDQAHIPGSEYAGPATTPAGLQVLRDRVTKLPRNAAIVIYCGCCPWTRCPNIAAAFDALKKLGFSNVKALYVADNFGADWVEHGYPTTKQP
jgi:rhodanese-related sulfurtransferase